MENDIIKKFSNNHLRVFKGIMINQNWSVNDLGE